MLLTTTTTTARMLASLALVAVSAACAAKAPKDTAPSPEGRPATSSSSDATIPGGTAGNAQVYNNMFDMIRAQSPGVQVVRGAEGPTLRIRGMSSPNGINDPLIIVDGVVSSLPGARALEQINPSDVLKIEVLKDAASTAMYGMRGGSGVIVITTKKK